MARAAAFLPGYATVARSGGVLHLAARSVRDLIYAGRLPSLRIGRLHYIRTADLELERRRRLGIRLPAPKPRARRSTTAPKAARPRLERGRVDPDLRRERAAERVAQVSQWVDRHHLAATELPFAALTASEAGECGMCGRTIRAGARFVQPAQDAQGDSRVCITCGRRVLLNWADQRRLEAAAARRMAENLGSPAEDLGSPLLGSPPADLGSPPAEDVSSPLAADAQPRPGRAA